MIVYPLACDRGHHFEGWFASSDAHDRQAAAGQLQCPSCASPRVRKLLSAPHVKTGPGPVAPTPAMPRAEALAALRTFILANTDDVGRRFAEVARRIHYQEEEARNIRGQVTGEEAEELREEGVEAFAVSPDVLPPGGEVH